MNNITPSQPHLQMPSTSSPPSEPDLLKNVSRLIDALQAETAQRQRLEGMLSAALNGNDQLVAMFDMARLSVKLSLQLEYGHAHVFDTFAITGPNKELIPWLNDHNLDQGYMICLGFVAIRDPDAAFHFKMRWIG